MHSDLDERKKTANHRTLYPCETSKNKITIDGKTYLNFSSNDYLCLSEDSFVIKKAKQYLKKWGAGSTASRLICGNYQIFNELEEKIAQWKKTESALLYGSGYLANLGIIPHLIPAEGKYYLDRLCHASMIDAVQLSKKKWTRFQHNDLRSLEHCLQKDKSIHHKAILVESVYSMDGDRADITQLIKLIEKYHCLLYIDEAHATGLWGSAGAGLGSKYQLNKHPQVVYMGTLGKAFGATGAYFAGNLLIKNYLINFSRTFIYNTAPSPAVIGAVEGSLQAIQNNPQWGRRLLKKSQSFRKKLLKENIPLVAGDSQIVSVLTKENQRTLNLSDFLKSRGKLAVAIRPPTVPIGKARLRISINRLHSEKQLNDLAQDIISFFNK